MKGLLDNTVGSKWHNVVSRAEVLATTHHKDQMYGELSYVDGHLRRVVDYVSRFTDENEVLAAAWLHDIVEDTDVTLDELNLVFPWRVEFCVRLVTDPEGKNRKERKAKLYEQFNQSGLFNNLADVALVKAADRYVNQETSIREGNSRMLNLYTSEFPAFMGCFGVKLVREFPEVWDELFAQYRTMLLMQANIEGKI